MEWPGTWVLHRGLHREQHPLRRGPLPSHSRCVWLPCCSGYSADGDQTWGNPWNWPWSFAGGLENVLFFNIYIYILGIIISTDFHILSYVSMVFRFFNCQRVLIGISSVKHMNGGFPLPCLSIYQRENHLDLFNGLIYTSCTTSTVRMAFFQRAEFGKIGTWSNLSGSNFDPHPNLVGGLEHFLFSYILGIIIPID